MKPGWNTVSDWMSSTFTCLLLLSRVLIPGWHRSPLLPLLCRLGSSGLVALASVCVLIRYTLLSLPVGCWGTCVSSVKHKSRRKRFSLNDENRFLDRNRGQWFLSIRVRKCTHRLTQTQFLILHSHKADYSCCWINPPTHTPKKHQSSLQIQHILRDPQDCPALPTHSLCVPFTRPRFYLCFWPNDSN